MNNWISLLPPLLAISLAITTRKAYLAIFSGIVAGSLILAPSFLSGLVSSVNAIALTLQSPSALKSLLFILMIGSIIHLLQCSGAIRCALFIITEKKWIRNRTHAQLLTFGAGFLMCLEGVGSMMMVGVIGRQLFTNHQVSKQKLAFVANGTGAPLAWLLPISSAGIFLTSLIQVQIEQGIIEGVATQLVMDSVHYQFYTLFILLSVPLLSVLPHDFKYEQEKSTIQVVETHIEQSNPSHPLWVLMAPLYLLILSIVTIATVTGSGNPINGDISNAIYWSGYIALVGSALLYRLSGIKFNQTLRWVFQGVIQILPAVIILTLAFTLSHVIGELSTGNYLAQIMVGHISEKTLPAIIFLIGIAISFATGSSGATVSILIPIALPMAAQMGLSLPLIIGAVISGAVFGDQSSPISDSIIVASSAAGCSPESHFRTQLPITLSVATMAFISYLLVTTVI